MKKILIIKFSALGDIIHTLPALYNLKQQGNVSITWFVSRTYKEILEGNPCIDKLIIFERERWRGFKTCLTRLNEIWKTIKEIRKEQFDIVIDFQGLFRSGFFTLLSGAKRRIGFASARELAFLGYNEKIKIDSGIRHAIDKNALLAKHVTGREVINKYPVYISKQVKVSLEEWGDKKTLIAIVPGTRWESKRWSTRNFAKLIDMAVESCKARLLILGGKSDRPLAAKILKLSTHGEYIKNLTGETNLKELVSIISEADVVISNDSGPMHIAVATDTPVIGLFGPTDISKTGPVGEKHTALIAQLPCSPCRNRVCDKKPFCMDELLPEDVFKILEKKLYENK